MYHTCCIRSLCGLPNRVISSTIFIPFPFSEPLVIDSNTTMNQIFRKFTKEETFIFNCSASGTGLALVWYKNGEQIPEEGSSLTIPLANPNDSGVYQCFWANESRPSQIFDSVSWAVVVRDRGKVSLCAHTHNDQTNIAYSLTFLYLRAT